MAIQKSPPLFVGRFLINAEIYLEVELIQARLPQKVKNYLPRRLIFLTARCRSEIRFSLQVSSMIKRLTH